MVCGIITAFQHGVGRGAAFPGCNGGEALAQALQASHGIGRDPEERGAR